MPLEFQPSQKGKPQLVVNGHLFSLNRNLANGNRSWRCHQYINLKCSARVHTDQNDSIIVQELGDHNHAADAAKMQAKAKVNELRGRARETQETPQQLIANVTAGVNQAIAAQMPSPSSLKRTAQRVRNRENAPVPIPPNLIELQVPDRYSVTIAGDQFLLHDSGPGNDRILIFSTASSLQLLSQNRHWYADGTFKTVPLLFEQLYTIHRIQGDSVMPAVYTLLPNKQGVTYLRLFAAIKNLQAGLNPETIMTDFELSAINSFMAEFPNAQQRGCFFHFNQCIWRKLQDLGLKRRYEMDEIFANQVKMIPALAFVLPNDVIGAFEILVGENHLAPELNALIDYFEGTWIGRLRPMGRRIPNFPVGLWNCYEAVRNGLAKNNNSCEGWHRGFSQLVGAEHPSIWNFIEFLRKDQSLNQFKIE